MTRIAWLVAVSGWLACLVVVALGLYFGRQWESDAAELYREAFADGQAQSAGA